MSSAESRFSCGRPLSFWIPTGAGERLSLSLSVIIAVSVYQLLAVTLVPLGTDKMPILVIFLAVLVVLVNFSVVITMINLKIAYAIQVEGPPRWLFKILVIYFGKVIRINRYYEFKNYKKAIEAVESQKSKFQLSLIQLQITQARVRHKKTDNDKTENDNEDYSLDAAEKLADVEWDLISLTMDRFCMIVYFLVFMGMLIWLFVQMGAKNDQISKYHEEIMSQDKHDTYNCDYYKANGTLNDDGDEYKQYFCDLK